MVDGTKEKQNERCASRSWWKMINPTKLNPHPTSEIVAYHKGKRIFLSLTDMEKENPDELQICEFKGQNFELFAD